MSNKILNQFADKELEGVLIGRIFKDRGEAAEIHHSLLPDDFQTFYVMPKLVPVRFKQGVDLRPIEDIFRARSSICSKMKGR